MKSVERLLTGTELLGDVEKLMMSIEICERMSEVEVEVGHVLSVTPEGEGEDSH